MFNMSLEQFLLLLPKQSRKEILTMICEAESEVEECLSMEAEALYKHAKRTTRVIIERT